MHWYIPIYEWLVTAAQLSLIMLLAGSAAVLCCRQSVRKIRLIQLTLAGVLVGPWLAMIPGYPQWSLLQSSSPAAQAADQSSDPILLQAAVSPSNVVPNAVETLPATQAMSEAQVSTPWFADWPRDYRYYVVVGYLSGVCGLILWWFVGMAALLCVLSRCKRAPGECHSMLAVVAGSHASGVSLLVGRHEQPFTFSWMRPVIVLPTHLCQPDQARPLRWCLAHEWSHVERQDVRTWTLAGIARVAFFYQPLVWWLRGQLRLCQDFIADSRAAGQAETPEDYAAFLTAFLARTRQPLAAGLGIGGRKSDLYRRVIMLVQEHRRLETACPLRWSVAAAACAIVLIAVLSGLRAAPPEAAGDQPEVTGGPDGAAENATEKNTANQDDEVQQAIRRAVVFLEVSQHPSGAWEELATGKGGVTALCTLAMLRAGTDAQDARLQRALGYLRQLQPDTTYVVAVQTLALAAGEPQKDADQIRRNVAWLEKAQRQEGAAGGGWRYTIASQDADGSNSHYAILALYAAQQAGAEVSKETWQRAVKYWTAVQSADGSWPYMAAAPGTRTMTCAGMASLSMAALQAGADQAEADAYKRSIERGAAWLGKNFELTPNGWQFYYLHALQSAGRMTGQKRFGEHDWYRDGVELLLKQQERDGGWSGTGVENNDDLTTAFALLFLCPPKEPAAGAQKTSDKAASELAKLLAVQETIEPLDLLKISVAGTLSGQPIHETYLVEPGGAVALGPAYGRVDVNQLTVEQAERAITGHLKRMLKEPEISIAKVGHLTSWRMTTLPGAPTVEMPGPLPYRIGPGHQLKIVATGTLLGQDVAGTYIVEKEGTVPMGPAYGRVKVEGLTPAEAEKAIERKLKVILHSPEVSVTLGGWEPDDRDQRLRELEKEVRGLKKTINQLRPKPEKPNAE